MSAFARRRLVAVAALLACGVAVALIAGGGEGGGASRAESTAGASAARASGAQRSARFPASWRSHRGPVPILEYHAIQPPVPSSVYPQLFVPQADFEAQMHWLHDHGYEAVTLRTVEAAWDGRGKLPRRPVVITFDDGYRSQFVGGFPIMHRFGWPGVLNLIASGADLPDADARRMIDAGWELASHTIHHADVTTLDQPRLREEIDSSRQELQRRFGVRVTDFCYPAGHYDRAAIAELRRAGYAGATTELPGLAERSDPYTLARLEIELSDGLPGFVAKLRNAAPQGPSPPSA